MYNVIPITSPKHLDCGATCLKMLLAYYDTDVDLNTLIEECHTSISGCSAADIMRVGNLHGMEMHTYRMDAEELLRQDRPAIIWWKYNHWCVCCGKDNGQAVICNPDRGRYHMPISTFAAMYSGVALFNGEPEDLPPEPEPDAETDELAEAARILLGVSE